jgi:hypothetical protein
LAFWNGKINLHNISLKHAKINQILREKNIPFSVKYSHIGSLEIDIPWKSLSTTPVEVKIAKVYIVLRMEKVLSVTKNIEEIKLSLLKNYLEHLISKTLANEKLGGSEAEGGFVQKMTVKIIHNLNADVRDISIRIVHEQARDSKTDLEGNNFSLVGSDGHFPSRPNSNPHSHSLEYNGGLSRANEKSFAFGFCVQSFNV